MRNISKENEGVQFILVLQDIFSKYIFTAPLKQETASNVIEALISIFAAGKIQKVLRTNKGSEFKKIEGCPHFEKAYINFLRKITRKVYLQKGAFKV